MDTRIYVMTHKAYTKPEDDLYISLHVGRELGTDLGYLGDHTGDNLSKKNKHYCELTGLYWIWKNVQCDIVGICHYRRYFVHDEKFLDKEYIEKVLENTDIIVSRSECTQYNSLYEHYQQMHHEYDMKRCKEVIREYCPEYLDAFDLCMNCNLFSLGNMMICRKSIFDDYCSWLFSILFEVEKRIDISSYDEYQSRVMGFLSERLMRVWLLQHAYKIREEKVEMMNPEDSENAVKSVQLKYQYVKLRLKDLITLYHVGNYMDMGDLSPLSVDLHGKIPVWSCWWQGEEEAPELVKMCFESMRKNIPDEQAELHIITLDNVGQYITLPQWIIDHYNAGRITLTHLSDILRAGLLYRYGGMWIDATYYVAKPFSKSLFSDYEFYTQKMEKPVWRADISQGRWAGNFMIGKAGNLLFRFMLNAFYVYWCTCDSMIDYYLIDYVIASAYDNIPEVKKMIDDCPYSEPNVFELEKKLNRRYRSNVYEELIRDTTIFKLSHKIPVEKETIGGDQTLYGYFCEHWEHDKM